MTSFSPTQWVVCVAIKDQSTCIHAQVQGDNGEISSYKDSRLITGLSGLSTRTGAWELLFEEATLRRKYFRWFSWSHVMSSSGVSSWWLLFACINHTWWGTHWYPFILSPVAIQAYKMRDVVKIISHLYTRTKLNIIVNQLLLGSCLIALLTIAVCISWY